MPNCPKCGSEVSLDMRLCSKCGANLTQMSPLPPPPGKPITVERGMTKPIQPEEKAVSESVSTEKEQMQYTEPPSDKKPLYISILAVIIAIIALLASLGLIFPQTEPEEEEEENGDVTEGPMTYYELLLDYDLYESGKFLSYDEGDEVKFRDTIMDINYIRLSPFLPDKYTLLSLKSLRGTTFEESYYGGEREILNGLILEGDRRGEFSIGEERTFTVKIHDYTVNGVVVEDFEEHPSLRAHIYGEYGPYFDVSILPNGDYNLTLNTTIYSEYNTTLVSNKCTLVSYNSSTIIDVMNPLVDQQISDNGSFSFYDANSSGEVDLGDYFIISKSSVGSGDKYVINYYVLYLYSYDDGNGRWGFPSWSKILGWI